VKSSNLKIVTLGLWAMVAAPGTLLAATRLCVEVRADPKNQEALTRLVQDELGHHPTHQVVEADCPSKLQLELFVIEGVTYLTARINQEVPVRYNFKRADELSGYVTDAVAQVLSHDPVYLVDDITHYSAVQRAAHSVLKRGHNSWRLELFQGIGRGEGNAAFAPGGAISMSRGADHWQVFARVYFAGWPGAATGADRVLQVYTGADAGLTYEFSALSSFSFYVSAGLGVQYLRYQGRVDPNDPQSQDYRNDFGPSLSMRLGARFLRLYDFDCDLFVAGYLPMFPADVDTRLGTFYPPSLQAGLGVGF
jgi:hypothetical protein